MFKVLLKIGTKDTTLVIIWGSFFIPFLNRYYAKLTLNIIE